MMTPQQARQRRCEIVERMEAISQLLASENRKNMTQREDDEFSALMVEIDECKRVLSFFGNVPAAEGAYVDRDTAEVIDVGELRREANSLRSELLANRCDDLLYMLDSPPNPAPIGYFESIAERLDNFRRGLAVNFFGA